MELVPPIPITPTRVRPWTRCRICGHCWHLNEPITKPRDCPGCKSMLWASTRWKKLDLPVQLPEGTIWVTCARCGYQWFRRDGRLPIRCASRPCGTPYWLHPRTQRVAAA